MEDRALASSTGLKMAVAMEGIFSNNIIIRFQGDTIGVMQKYRCTFGPPGPARPKPEKARNV